MPKSVAVLSPDQIFHKAMPLCSKVTRNSVSLSISKVINQQTFVQVDYGMWLAHCGTIGMKLVSIKL